MSLVNRFTDILQGAMVLTGNTLNIHSSTASPPQTPDYINGSYISLNSGLTAGGGFPGNTTNNPLLSGSTAVLNIPSGSTIKYAQLFWSIIEVPAAVPTRNNAITFSTPAGSMSISPNLSYNQSVGSDTYRAIDVTSIVNTAGTGTYSVSGVPGNTTANNSTYVGNGWWLLVVYENKSMPFRYFNVNTGLTNTAYGSDTIFNFTGFSTPSSGPIKAYFTQSGIWGDFIDSTQIFIGANSGSAVKVGNATIPWNGLAPYAPINAMMPGSVLIADTNDPNIGLIDTRGSFGTNNRNPFDKIAPAFSRDLYDTLGMDISNILTHNQTTLYTRTHISSGDPTAQNYTTSQSVQVDVNSANLSPVSKTVDKSYSINDDTLTYLVIFKNTGLTTANNVVFLDTLPSGINFVSGSLTVNSIPNGASSLLPPGVSLGNISSGAATTLVFKATVNTTLPVVKNTCDITYNFIPAVSLPTQYADSQSNTAVTTIASSSMLSNKMVNEVFSHVSDILTYTITFSNVGTSTYSNIIFIDTIPNATSLVPGSFTVNGLSQGGSPNPPGITIPDIGVGNTATIVFQVTVDTVPSQNPIVNTATTSYNLIIDPSIGNTTSAGSSTNSTSTFILTGINPSKIVDKQFATIGDTITYTLMWNELIGFQSTNVTFIDTIPDGFSFISNSVTVNGVSLPGATVTPPNGIDVGTVPAGGATSVTFQVLVSSIPQPNPAQNNTTTTYSTTVSIGLQSAISNTVPTAISYASIPNMTKSVDHAYATVGDILNYTITLANTGNVSASNVVFIDTLPSVTILVPNSFSVNNIPIPGADPSPPSGVNLGSIPVGITTLTFQVTVNSLPNPNTIVNSSTLDYSYLIDPINNISGNGIINSNIVQTTINFAHIQTHKISNNTFTNIPVTITYAIALTNTGNVTATNILFVDTIPTGTNFVPNSLMIDGITLPGNPDPPGITIPDLAPGLLSTVTFEVTVVSIPSPNPIVNIATGGYTFEVDPNSVTLANASINTNLVTNFVSFGDLSGITKVVDKQYAICGDTITYIVTIPNTGNVSVQNVVLNDTIPNGTAYVPGSLTVNGSPVGGTPSSINIGSIQAGATATVRFQVKIIC